MVMSQMCTGAGDYFRTSKPHSEKLCNIFYLEQRGLQNSDGDVVDVSRGELPVQLLDAEHLEILDQVFPELQHVVPREGGSSLHHHCATAQQLGLYRGSEGTMK